MRFLRHHKYKERFLFWFIFFLCIRWDSPCTAGGTANLSRTENNKVFVQKIIDGDTIILSDNRIVRYLGIDTPETRKKIEGKWVDIFEPYGKEAYELNKKLIANKRVRIEYDYEKKDSYNRELGYIFVDNIFVNEEILKEGLAFPYLKDKNLKYQKRLQEAFLKAVMLRKNLYRINLRYEKDLNRFLGQNVFFEGTVRNIIRDARGTDIIFDRIIARVLDSKRRFNIGDYLYVYGTLRRKGNIFIIVTNKGRVFKLN